MPEPSLVVRGVTRAFSARSGVHDLDLDVAAGEIHALVGLNGAGKTTLLRLVLGMLRPAAGSIRIGGRDVGAAGASTWGRVGHLVGGPIAYGELDTRTNLALAARLHGVPRREVTHLVERALTELALDDYADVRACDLSDGNRRRLGLVAALLHDPDVIVLDEPTSTLDPAGVVLLRKALLSRARAGAAILVSSHHLDEVARVAGRITVLNRGRVIGSLDPHGIDLERTFFALVHADDERAAA